MMQYLLLAVAVGVLPLCIGMLPVRFMEEKHKSAGMVYLAGFLVMLGCFQFAAIPFIAAEGEFQALAKLYTLLLLLLAAAGIVLGRRDISLCLKRSLDIKPIWIVIFILILIQMFFSYHMQYLDGDDAFFGVTALGIQNGDGMYLKNPYFGYAQQLDMRHALSPIPVFIAWLGRFTGIHATILSHSYLGAVFLLLMYVAYIQLGKTLFQDKQRNAALFVLFVNLWYLFGNVSLYTAETFAYTRTWQGKAMFGNIVVPSIFLLLLFAAKQEMKKGEWVLLFLLSAVAALTTSTGIFMYPILMAAAGLIIAAGQKKLMLLPKFAVCCIPSILYGLLYLILK